MKTFRKTLVLAAILAAARSVSPAWIFPEHREITLRAIQSLDPARRAALDRLWAAARTGHESRLSLLPADTVLSETPATIDLAAWPAIAGDHSCSAAEMLTTVLESAWILDVAAVCARLQTDLSKAGLERHERTNALRTSDLSLLRVDPQYASRAGANNVHFLLARPYPETDEKTYVETCLALGCEPNAIGTYAWYHLSSLQKAYRLSRGGLTTAEAGSLARAALADQAYALHFLQDAFAAGHVAGTRGDASQRKGTHDYYNEAGLEVRTWGGKSIVVKGDAWMRSEDAERSAVAVRASLAQFIDVLGGTIVSPSLRSDQGGSLLPDTLNTCLFEQMPDRNFEGRIGQLLGESILATPVPGLAEGEGELPRFRAEVGPFIGIAPALRLEMIGGGFGEGQTTNGGVFGLDVSARIGLGLDGVLNESGDGLIYLDLGIRLDAPSTNSIYDDAGTKEFGQIFAAIPARGALTSRIRIPFYLIPFDLLIAAPLLLPFSPETFTGMAALAGNGGLIPWQAGVATSFGRFQVILGREVAVTFNGYLKNADNLILPAGTSDAVLADVRSIQLEFPFLEYRPFRTFSLDQTSSLVFKFYGGVDIPTSVSDVKPLGAPDPVVQSVWQLGVRVAFDWRYYW
jgi:hypothetical protein